MNKLITILFLVTATVQLSASESFFDTGRISDEVLFGPYAEPSMHSASSSAASALSPDSAPTPEQAYKPIQPEFSHYCFTCKSKCNKNEAVHDQHKYRVKRIPNRLTSYKCLICPKAVARKSEETFKKRHPGHRFTKIFDGAGFEQWKKGEEFSLAQAINVRSKITKKSNTFPYDFCFACKVACNGNAKAHTGHRIKRVPPKFTEYQSLTCHKAPLTYYMMQRYHSDHECTKQFNQEAFTHWCNQKG